MNKNKYSDYKNAGYYLNESKIDLFFSLKANIEDPKVQEEYYKIREEIIVGNLGLCKNFAKDYCSRFNTNNQYEDIYMECVYALELALDSFNPQKSSSFSTYCYTFMENHLRRIYYHDQKDALADFRDNYFIHKYPTLSETPEMGTQLDWFQDTSESSISEDFANKDLLERINNFIDQKFSARNAQIYKMYVGFGYPRPYTLDEIGKIFGLTRSRIGQIIQSVEHRLELFMRLNFDAYYTEFYPENSKSLTFSSIEERNLYFYESYYGLNGRTPKSTRTLSMETSFSQQTINRIIRNMSRQKQPFFPSYDEHEKDLGKRILQAYYGIDCTPQSPKEIVANFNISDQYLQKILKNYTKYISPEAIKKAREQKRAQLTEEKLLFWATLYCKSKGINGYQHSCYKSLAMEYRVFPATIAKYINNFKNYYASLTRGEQLALLAKVCKNPEKD